MTPIVQQDVVPPRQDVAVAQRGVALVVFASEAQVGAQVDAGRPERQDVVAPSVAEGQPLALSSGGRVVPLAGAAVSPVDTT